MLDGQNDDAVVAMDPRFSHRGSRKRRTIRNSNFFDDHFVSAIAACGQAEEIDNIRSKQSLCDLMPSERIRRNYRIGAGLAQVLGRFFFTGACNDFQMCIEAARIEDDEDIAGIGSGCSD